MKKLSLFLIGILFSSIFSITDVSVFGINDQNTETNFYDTEIIDKSNLQTTTDHNVLLFESVAIVTNDGSNHNNVLNDSNASQQQIQSTKNISLTEKLSILENDKLDNLINYVKHNSEKLATLERVNPNRIRDSLKSNFDEITLSSVTSEPIINNYNTNDLINKQLLDTVKYSIPTFSIFDFVQNYDIFSNNFDPVASTQNVIAIADENNQYFLVLLVPLSGYILLRTESRNNNFINTRLASSSILTIILISSAILTPFSIGSNYWGIAYAEEFSFSGIIEDVNNLESNTLTTEPINATATEPINATATEPINATATEPINATATEPINATATEPINATATEPINATATEPINATATEPINATATEPINATATEPINATATEPINATATEPINATATEPINATATEITPDIIIVDDTLLDLNFDTENTNQTNSTTLQLDGNDDFITIQNNSTDILSTFTISGWIKPDYSNGSNEFTVISKENSFILSINNNITPEHIAKFSIFDGTKWTYVESNSTIPEQWTHISTTFDGNHIKIYINGQLDAITELANTIIISANGQLVETDVSTIYSDQDIIIGAYVSTNDGSPQSQNSFSGEIDAISIHDSIFDEQKLTQIYQEQLDYYTSLDVELSLEEIMQQIIQENALATNSTLIQTNSTVIQLDLIHEEIEIGKLVMWTQTIELSNKTDGITIELPEDAEITQVTTMEQQIQETLYNAEGIMNNVDIKDNQIDNLRIENSTNPEQYDTLIASLDEIPEQIQQDKPTKLLIVNDTADQIEIKFETPAPYVIEQEYSTNSLYNKTVTVAHDSTLHYTNVTSYSAIPEDLVSQGIVFDLFWNINGTKVNVTSDPNFAVQFVDTDGNGIIDQMQWIVPQMSEQDFEIVANIIIVNVQSYPVVGDTWEVRFTTNGTADLIISAINGTTFGESLPDDLKLLSIKCGENIIQHQWVNGSIIIQNYTCSETGYETSQVLTPGKHHLEFRFGNSIGYANNNAFFVSEFSINLPLGVDTSNDNFLSTSVNDSVVNVTSSGTINWNQTSSGTGNGAFDGPTGIAVNSTGYIYIADTGNDRIQIFTPESTATYSSQFGTLGSGDNQFTTPIGIAIDSSNNVYVADTGNDRITKHNKDGSFIEAYGTGFGSGDNQFSGPTGIAVNSTGYIYIADTGNDRIKILTPSGEYYSQFGTLGSGDNQFTTPIGIAIDSSNNVYVADTGNDRITKHNKDGSFIEAFGTFGTGSTNFDGPTGISVFSSTNSIYTADTGNDKIKKYDTGTRSLTESLSLTASVTTSVSGSVSLTESLPFTATATTSASTSVSLTESLPFTATATTSASASVSLTESLPFTDTVNTVTSKSVSLTESLPFTAAATTSASASVSLTESLPFTAAATTSAVLSVSLTESLPFTATATTSASKSVSLTESLPFTDTVNTVTSKSVSLTESLPFTATATTSAVLSRSLTESLPFTAAATTSAVLSVSLTESLPFTATATTSASKSVSLTESLPFTDTVNTVTSKSVSLTESLPFTATATTSAVLSRSLTESLPFTAAATTSAVLSVSLTESLPFTATATTSASKSVSLTESLPFTDTVNTVTSKSVSLTESLPFTAAATTSASASVSLTESLPFTATATTSAVLSRSLTESLPFTATATTSASTSVSLTESLPFTDTVNTVTSKSVSLTESLPFTATATTSAVLSRSLTESLPFTATATTSAVLSVSLTESLPFTATATTSASKSVSLTESLPFTDTVNTVTSKSVSLTESLPFTATATTSAVLSRSLTESLPFTAAATTSAVLSVSLTESLPFTATATTSASKSVSLTESLPFTDTVNTVTSKSVSLTESLPFTATATTSAVLSRSLTESLPFTATATTSASTSVSLTESLPFTAAATTSASKSVSLTESLPFTDTVNTVTSKSVSLTESLPFTATATTSAVLSRSLTESLPFTATATTSASTSVSLTESLPFTAAATTSAVLSVSLTESLPFTDTVNITKSKSVSLTESLPFTATATTSAVLSRSLTESLPFTALASITASTSVSLTESLPLTDRLNKNIVDIKTDYLRLTDNLAISFIPGNTTLPVKLYPGSTTTAITLSQNNTSIILTNSSIVQTITISDSVAQQLVINYTSLLSGTTVTVPSGFAVIFNTTNTNSATIAVNATISNSTILTGPSGWNGILDLPTVTSVTVPSTTTDGVTTTYSEITAFVLGVDGATIQLSSPARLKFTGSGTGNPAAFYVGTSGVTNIISTECTSDSASGMPSGADECYYDNGDDLIVWTDHFTKFGASQRSTSSSSSSSSSGGGDGTSGSAGKTGVGPAGTTRGFGGILSTPLTINEIIYDRCEANMATILVSSDADKAPSVVVHTARSGSVPAKLANIQPYEQSNKITKLDKYLYEIPITSDETFLMVVVTEEKGVSKNTVQAAIHLTSCEGSTEISKVPEEKPEEIAPSAPKIFDVKFQIENSTQHSSETESEFSYVDNQDLIISAIVNVQNPLQRSELRIITIGQSQEYVAIKMDVEPLLISNSTYVISATIPSSLMQEPAIAYWIHIIDENQNESESKQYTIGVKPISVGDVTFEMDIASVKESGSLVRPQLFVDNNDLPSYGIVSLIVNGEVIYKKSQLFTTGETIVNLEWKSPSVDEHTIYNVIASVDLYDKSISTQSAKLHIYPKTITMLASEIKPLEPITENDTVLADPALIYASNSVDQNLRFHVIAPNGQCLIGVSEECAIHGSTANQRGGLTSIEYEDQIIRVRYSDPDSPLERFSITSIDPLDEQWTVSLETSDGIIPQAQAMKDLSIKVKYRTHSETITVYSE